MRSIVSVLLLAMAAAAACSSSVAPDPGVIAHGVRVTATADPTQLSGVGYDIELANGGTNSVFLEPCGSSLLLIVEQRVGGEWVRGPGPDCLPSSGPRQLAAGAATSQVTSFGLAGEYRVGIRVSTSASFTAPLEAMSPAFRVQ